MMKSRLIKFAASGLYFGYSPVVPGSTGTIPAWVIGYFLIRGDLYWLIAAAISSTFISIWISGKAELILGHDAKKIVIDEWAGMFIALILIPFSLLNYVIAFGSFRALDAVKFFPARSAERLPRGWGVTADDVVAGIQANLLTRLVIFAIGCIRQAI
jgi:phosphatidylglycerophosphatase A